MNVNLRQIRSFAAIAALKSFTRAARALNLSQPSLTVQIRQLEQSVGARLLDRNTRSVLLTPIGEALLPTFQRVLRELDGAIADARDLTAKRRGLVRLACLPSFAATLLPAAIAGFRARYPNVRFVIKDAVGQRIAAMVKDGAVDFGVTAGAVDDPDLATRELLQDRMHAIFPADHPLARAKRITPQLLRQHPLILMDRDSTVRQVVDAGFASHGEAPEPAFETTYMATAVGMVQAGLGVALLPSSAIEARNAAQIVSRPVAGREFRRQMWLVRPPNRSLPPAADAFVEHLVGSVRRMA
jgi:DNA-binding transcriptional LysR family regulator